MRTACRFAFTHADAREMAVWDAGGADFAVASAMFRERLVGSAGVASGTHSPEGVDLVEGRKFSIDRPTRMAKRVTTSRRLLEPRTRTRRRVWLAASEGSHSMSAAWLARSRRAPSFHLLPTVKSSKWQGTTREFASQVHRPNPTCASPDASGAQADILGQRADAARLARTAAQCSPRQEAGRHEDPRRRTKGHRVRHRLRRPSTQAHRALRHLRSAYPSLSVLVEASVGQDLRADYPSLLTFDERERVHPLTRKKALTRRPKARSWPCATRSIWSSRWGVTAPCFIPRACSTADRCPRFSA